MDWAATGASGRPSFGPASGSADVSGMLARGPVLRLALGAAARVESVGVLAALVRR